jgi:hypothetical protein
VGIGGLALQGSTWRKMQASCFIQKMEVIHRKLLLHLSLNVVCLGAEEFEHCWICSPSVHRTIAICFSIVKILYAM